MEDYRFDNLKKAIDAETLIWTHENVSNSPDVWTSNLKFEHRHQLSDANPQQKMFIFGRVSGWCIGIHFQEKNSKVCSIFLKPLILTVNIR